MMEDSTAIGLAMVGCAYFGFFMVLGLLAIVGIAVQIVIELIKEVVNKVKKAGNDDNTRNY